MLIGDLPVGASTEFAYGADAPGLPSCDEWLSLRPELTVGSACLEHGIYTLRSELAPSGTPGPS